METVNLPPEQTPLQPGLLAEESSFYGGYSWSLNPILTVREIIHQLREEISRLEKISEDWRYVEVSTNVYLLASHLTAAVDDYLAGAVYDFSRAARFLPFLRPVLSLVELLQSAHCKLRQKRLRPLLKWKQNWEKALDGYLMAFLETGTPNRQASAQARICLLSVLQAKFPDEFLQSRPKIPGAFRSKDLTHFDILRLADRFSAAFPNLQQPLALIGLRTAGSFFATISRVHLLQRGYENIRSVTLRPKSGVSPWEAEVLAERRKAGALAVVVDEHPNTGITFVRTRDILRRCGFEDQKIVFLFPVHPAHADWRNVLTAQGLSKIRVIHIEPDEWFKAEILNPDAVERQLNLYFRARRYRNASVVQSSSIEHINKCLPELSDDKVLTRLKRAYEVRLETETGATEYRRVLAKSVGWGWWGYHAFLAGDKLAAFVPPVLGVRNGILYSEWLSSTGTMPASDQDRNHLVRSVASYIAARARTLGLGKDPTADLVRQHQHQAYEIIAKSLAKAYGRMAPLKLGRIRLALLREPCPFPSLIDGRMDKREWVDRPSALLKADFEHHGLGKTELNLTDPVFDIAQSILCLDLSEREEKDLVDQYHRATTDNSIEQRLFLYKLLAGLWESSVMLARINDRQFPDRKQEFNKRFTKAWNFLTLHTMRYCASFCHRPTTISWRSPLVFLDIDGVLDWKIFGFPSTTAAGIEAVSLLHTHGFSAAFNSARSLEEIKEYCKAYSFAGGVAEYGSVLWDSVTGREQSLIDEESISQMRALENYLADHPGVFLDSSYHHSIRAFTYENRGRVPLSKLFIQDVLHRLRLDRLCWHNTNVDTAILARGIDKGTGLLALLNWIGIPQAETIAIGDSETDLPMFRAATRSFAPSQIGCRSEAERFGCRIADRPFQSGLLRTVGLLAHPDGKKCKLCPRPGRPFGDRKSLFLDILQAADRGPLTGWLGGIFDRTALQAFQKK